MNTRFHKDFRYLPSKSSKTYTFKHTDHELLDFTKTFVTCLVSHERHIHLYLATPTIRFHKDFRYLPRERHTYIPISVTLFHKDIHYLPNKLCKTCRHKLLDFTYLVSYARPTHLYLPTLTTKFHKDFCYLPSNSCKSYPLIIHTVTSY